MSVDTRINTAIKSVVTEVSPNIYTGSSKEYSVYTYTEIPSVFANGKPNANRYLIQIGLYLPNGKNPNTLKKKIANALLDAGFTYPSITNVSDKDGQHYVFECEGTDGNI